MDSIASSALLQVFSDDSRDSTPRLPISSSKLLRHLILHGANLKLGDRADFDGALRALAQSWEHGILTLRNDDEDAAAGSSLSAGEAVVTSVTLTGVKKRKRDVGEDVDYSLRPSRKLSVSQSQAVNAELDEVYKLLQRGTAKGKLLAERYSSTRGVFEPICPHTTKQDCANYRSRFPKPAESNAKPYCDMIHFRPIIRQHTDPSLGHCSYLNTCFSEPTYSMSPSIHPLPAAPRPPGAALPSGLGAGGRGKDKAPCRYLHFEVDYDGPDDENMEGEVKRQSGSGSGSKSGKIPQEARLPIGLGPSGKLSEPYPPQWINCDLRDFDATALGKFHVIMADPPWDIHMSLPYGTMTDDEMKAMPIPQLQDEGLLFLWVTGRAMELGRECMQAWGYTRVDEVVWVKTNQLQRVIRTGRTGHWLNHTKEHMLVGIKTVHDPSTGELKWPSWLNRGLDTDVIVSEVRETSRKPDEVYGIIERMCPGGRKVEIFGRKHNTRPGWITLGNQLGHDMIHEPDLADRIRARYPGRAQTNAAMQVDQ